MKKIRQIRESLVVVKNRLFRNKDERRDPAQPVGRRAIYQGTKFGFFYITRPKTHVLSLLKLFINLQVVFNGIEDLVLRGCQLRSVRIEIGAIMKISSLFQIQTPGDKKN